MDYPKDFVQRVKAEYPEKTDLHQLLDAGSLDLNEYFKVRLTAYTPQDILAVLRSRGASAGGDELWRQCSEYERRMDLYYEWQRMRVQAT